MPLIILATDIPDDHLVTQDAPYHLRDRGFDHQLLTPLDRLPELLRVIAISGGRVDGILIVDTGMSLAADTDPLTTIKKVRELPDSLTFSGAVKARSIPIVAIVDGGVFYDDWLNARWVTSISPGNGCHGAGDFMMRAIFDWRRDLLSELECVGYAVCLDSAAHFRIDPAFRRRCSEGDILAATADLASLRAGKYVILSADLLADIYPCQELSFLLNHFREAAEAEKTRPEDLFQRFFEKNPHMILQDQFQAYWSHPQLRFPNAPEQSIVPDFVLKPRVAAHFGTKWRILDLKLPDEKLAVNTTFHATFTKKLIHAIQQLYDYREYFNRPDVTEQMVKTFGFHPKNPQLAVLIGRRQDQNKADVISETQGKLKMLDVDIISYEDILDAEVKRVGLQMEWIQSLT